MPPFCYFEYLNLEPRTKERIDYGAYNRFALKISKNQHYNGEYENNTEEIEFFEH